MSTFSKRHISIAAAFALLASGVTNLVTPSASAADMLEEQQETTQVEYGTGWYLRGDLSMTDNRNWHTTDLSVEVPPVGSIRYTIDEGVTFGYGVGVGYRFSENFRGDLGLRDIGAGSAEVTYQLGIPVGPCTNTIDNRSGTPVDGNTISNCVVKDTASFQLLNVMANGYYDFDAGFMGLKPFVGAGLGLARNSYESVTGTVTCAPQSYEACAPTDGSQADFGETITQEGLHDSGVSYHLAGSLHAGVGIPIGDNMFIDTQYTYTRVLNTALWGAKGATPEESAANFHALRLGFRIEIW